MDRVRNLVCRLRGGAPTRVYTQTNNENINNTDGVDNDCCVCCDEIRLFAAGECNHPICHVCSFRMRNKDNNLKCVMCRNTLLEVSHTTIII